MKEKVPGNTFAWEITDIENTDGGTYPRTITVINLRELVAKTFNSKFSTPSPRVTHWNVKNPPIAGAKIISPAIARSQPHFSAGDTATTTTPSLNHPAE
jgi:hypothetical protein